MRPHARILPILGSLSQLLLAACLPDFQSSAEVVDRRILAIQVDPPELAHGVPVPAAVSARALVVDPTTPRSHRGL